MTTRADEIRVGRYYGEREIVITPELVQHYADAVQDFNPWYFGDSPFGGAVAPALILHSEVYTTIDWYLSIFGNLHARQEWELFAPIMVGETVTARRQIIDRYRKRDRDYVVNETTVYGSGGRMLNRGRTHQSFLATTDMTGTVVDKDREKRSDRRFEASEDAVLEELAIGEKGITIEMCQKFSGPHKNYHNDKEEARRLGFPDIVVQGMMSLCFVSQMMTERYGSGWIYGGRMNVNLVNVLWQGEVVTAQGAVIGQTPEGPRTRDQVRAWCEKADGTKIVVGTASALSD
ncbi:MAG TPA: MaoC family dehydratase N-terminal domain-containing protein [Dehalococcoidia bacterium]|nr:MaoC family dehydratase N-terminal domain-containing protein [Dehalococcoidia bacterium]